MTIRKTPGYYILEHKTTGHYYIGSAKDLAARLASHKHDLNHGVHCNKRLQDICADWDDLEVSAIPMHSREAARRMEQTLLEVNFGKPLCVNDRMAIR